MTGDFARKCAMSGREPGKLPARERAQLRQPAEMSRSFLQAPDVPQRRDWLAEDAVRRYRSLPANLGMQGHSAEMQGDRCYSAGKGSEHIIANQ